MAEDRNASDRSARPLPESLSRLLLIDPTQPIEVARGNCTVGLSGISA